MQRVDRPLFEAWKSEDVGERNKRWLHFFQQMYTMAYHFCRSRSSESCYIDDDLARQLTSDACNIAFIEIYQKIMANQVEWKGKKSFNSFCRQRVIWRKKDEIDRWCSYKYRIVIRSLFEPVSETDEGEEIPFYEIVQDQKAGPDEIAKIRSNVRKIITDLKRLQDHLEARGSRALSATVKEIIEFFRLQITSPDENLSWDDLIDQLKPGDIPHMKKRDLYKHLMNHLGINRNILDQRMQRLRPLIEEILMEKG